MPIYADNLVQRSNRTIARPIYGITTHKSAKRDHIIRIAMLIKYSTSRHLALHRRVNRAHLKLIEFLEAHRATRVKPWTDEEAKQRNRLRGLWLRAIQDLFTFEHGL